jgi:hypothetical protein
MDKVSSLMRLTSKLWNMNLISMTKLSLFLKLLDFQDLLIIKI